MLGVWWRRRQRHETNGTGRLSQSVQNDVHIETGPCAGSCASSPSEFRSPKFWWEARVLVSPENPTAQDAVLSIKVIKTMARRVSHQYPDGYRTLSGDRQAGFLFTRTIWSNVSSNRGTLLNGYLLISIMLKDSCMYLVNWASSTCSRAFPRLHIFE